MSVDGATATLASRASVIKMDVWLEANEVAEMMWNFEFPLVGRNPNRVEEVVTEELWGCGIQPSFLEQRIEFGSGA